MIKQILVIVSMEVMIVGAIGIKSRTITSKLFFLCHTMLGVTLLSFVEWNEYAIIGGMFQLIFRGAGLLFLIPLLHMICKKNEIHEINDIDGIGRKMPYAYLALVLFSALVIGIPITGTFTGLIYSGMGFVADGMEKIEYVALIGNLIGFIIPSAIVFPVLKKMYFPVKGTEEKQVVLLADGVVALSLMAALILAVFCVYQKPILMIAKKAVEMMLD